jgi:Cys-rich repeat protein
VCGSKGTCEPAPPKVYNCKSDCDCPAGMTCDSGTCK